MIPPIIRSTGCHARGYATFLCGALLQPVLELHWRPCSVKVVAHDLWMRLSWFGFGYFFPLWVIVASWMVSDQAGQDAGAAAEEAAEEAAAAAATRKTGGGPRT